MYLQPAAIGTSAEMAIFRPFTAKDKFTATYTAVGIGFHLPLNVNQIVALVGNIHTFYRLCKKNITFHDIFSCTRKFSCDFASDKPLPLLCVQCMIFWLGNWCILVCRIVS
jgi:hypothetical protein